MPDSLASTRLGNLLLKKRRITQRQLTVAVQLQRERHQLAIQQGKPRAEHNELGEILVELGFISRYQLKYSLSWQRRMRRVAAVAMTFVAPLLTVACGGSSGGGSSTSGKQATSQSSPRIDTANSSKDASSALAWSTSSKVQKSSASTTADKNNSATSAPYDGFFDVSKSSSSSDSAPPKKDHPTHPTRVDGPVVINWSAPSQRENGEHLDIVELGGYELRYKLKGAKEYTHIKINDPFTDTYYFDYLKGTYEFEIAAFDVNGLYSDFAAIKALK